VALSQGEICWSEENIINEAIHLTAYGKPAQNLKMVEVSEPDMPSGGAGLVRMEYAPINYSDLLLANGVYFLKPKLPSVIGGEGAGIIEAIGPGVTSIKIGDRVTIPFGTFTWSEKVLLQPKVFSSFLLQSMPGLAVCQQLAAMRKEREAAELDEGSGAG
jgi:NADPH:quinone reductase-like Zn-dependent oxidoreductase